MKSETKVPTRVLHQDRDLSFGYMDLQEIIRQGFTCSGKKFQGRTLYIMGDETILFDESDNWFLKYRNN